GQPREYVVTTQPVSHGAFALTVDSDEYRPLLERNDVLLVDPGQRPGDGDLVLVEAGAGLPILCRVYPSAQPLFVHPVSGRPVRLPAGYERKPGPTVLGRVVGLQRVFGPRIAGGDSRRGVTRGKGRAQFEERHGTPAPRPPAGVTLPRPRLARRPSCCRPVRSQAAAPASAPPQ